MKVLQISIWAVWLPFASWLYLRSWFTQIFRTGTQFVVEAVAFAAAMAIWLILRHRWPRLDLLALALSLFALPLWRHPLATILAVVTCIAALGVGRFTMQQLSMAPKGAASQIVIAAGIGFSAWIVVLIAIGVAGLLRAVVIAAVLSVALIACRRGIVIVDGTLREIWIHWTIPGRFGGLQTIALVFLALLLQPVILTPSLLYDALATHLAASRNYSVHHSIAPSSEYDFLPQGLELMMGAADTVGGQAAEQMIEPVFLGLSWLALYAIARKMEARRSIASASATLAIAMPFAAWDGAVVKNDIAAAFFLLTALLTFLECWDVKRRTARGTSWIFVGAFLCAAAENVKHTALLGVAPLSMLFLVSAWREPRRARTISLAAGLFILCGGFWMARSALTHSDPLFPLRSAGAMEPMASAAFASFAERLSFLLHLQFEGRPIFEGTSTTRLGPLFLLLLPAFFWIRRSDVRSPVAATAFFALSYLIVWLWTWPVLRYAAAPVMLAALGITVLAARATHRVPLLLFAAMAFCYLCSFGNLVEMTLNMDRLKYLARLSGDDTYLSKNLPAYAAIAWTRDHPVPGKRILAVGTRSMAYAAEPAMMSNPFPDEGPFDPNAIRGTIEQGNFAYAILPDGVDARAVFPFVKREFESAGFGVYRIP